LDLNGRKQQQYEEYYVATNSKICGLQNILVG